MNCKDLKESGRGLNQAISRNLSEETDKIEGQSESKQTGFRTRFQT